MAKNDGKEAEKAFEDYWNAKPLTVLYRFNDQRDLRGLNGGRPVGDFPKPADYLLTHQGHTIYAEVKSTRSKTSFPFGDIRPSQKSMALRQAAVGGPYFFYIFSYGLGEWFFMDAKTFASVLDAGKASIKFEDLTIWKMQ